MSRKKGEIKKAKYNYRSSRFARTVFKRLLKHFGKLKPPLDFKTNEQLAVAVILSAQCTDERVNIVTKELFQECPDMHALNEISLARLKQLVYSTGFYNAKAKNIKALAHILVNNYNAKIPDDFETLIKLPGIGRKTANVIANQAFGQSHGIVVDTHVKRITNLLAFTKEQSPVKIEKDLMSFWPKDLWKDFPLLIIFHGRKFCPARRPKCAECILADLCPSVNL